jgi:hypothetical protein
MGWQDGTPVENTEQPAWMRGTPVNSAPSSADPRLAGIPNAWSSSQAAPIASASNTDVAINAANKGIAGIPDMMLNAPQNAANLVKTVIGMGGWPKLLSSVTGKPETDYMPEPTQPPDFARRGAEATGLINPNIVPKGFLQKAIDYGVQGAVGGALTGGGGLARTLTGAGMGALSGEAAGGVQEMTGRPGLAAVAGMAVPMAAGQLMSSSGRPLTPNQRLLVDEGVQLTPGQIVGGKLRRLEDGATSIPVLGDSIKGAQRRGVASFDTAAINRSLDPIGDRVPNGVRGNQAIEYARTRLGDAYENLLPNLRGDLNHTPGAGALPAQVGQPAIPSFRQELANIRQMGANLPEPQRGQLSRILDREIINRFTQNGMASGETLKDIESKLGTISRGYGRSTDYDVRTLGDAVQEAQAAMRRMVNNVNPQYQGELARINEGYANFKKVQDAAGRVGANEGVFSPAQLHSAVRAGDTSKDKRAFSEGNALMQDLSAAGKQVLPSTVPDSGTPFRAMASAAITHPLRAAGLGIPISLASLAYTPAGQQILQTLLTRQGNPLYSGVANQTSPIVTGGILEQLQRKQGQQQ